MSTKDHLLPHSPSQRNYSTPSGMELGSSSGSESHDNSDSNVSDMVVDVKTKFSRIKSKHRKSQDGDFVPSGDSKSNSGSRSESDSDSNSKLVIVDNGDEYSTSTTTSQSASPAPQRSKGHATPNNNTSSFYQRKIGQSPLINRDSSFKFNRSKSNSKYTYSLCPPSFDFLPPQRRAAANVRYNYSDDSDESEVIPRRPAQSRSHRRSDSEFDVSEQSEEELSNSDSFHDDDDLSEEEDYQPTMRKGKSRKGVSFSKITCVRIVMVVVLCICYHSVKPCSQDDTLAMFIQNTGVLHEWKCFFMLLTFCKLWRLKFL